MSAAAPTPNQSTVQEPPMLWPCSTPGCFALRVYEGGRPLELSHHDDCERCGSRIAAKAQDRASFAKIVTNHLL